MNRFNNLFFLEPGCCFFRNLIVISTAPTTWPNLMLSASSTFRVLTLNMEGVGVGCLGASECTVDGDVHVAVLTCHGEDHSK